MIGHKLENGNIELNTENLLDQRQSKLETLVDGMIINTIFKTVCGHLVGSALYLSVKLEI